MATEIIFASAQGQLAAIKKLLQENEQRGISSVVIALNEAVKKCLNAHEISCRTLLDYPTSADLRKETIDWVNEWSARKVGGKSFRERLVYQNFSLWGLIHPYLYATFEQSFDLIHRTLSLLEAEKPKKIYLNTLLFNSGLPAVLPEKAIISTALSRGIEVVSLPSSSGLPLPLKKFFSLVQNKLIGLMHWSWGWSRKTISRCVVFLALRVRPRKDSFTRSILFLSYEINWRKVFDQTSGGYIMEDVYLYPIIRELKKKKMNYRLLAIDTYYGEKAASLPSLILSVLLAELPNMVKKLVQRAFQDRVITWKSFYGYETREVRRKVKQSSRLFKQRWAGEINDENLKQSLSYKDVALWPLIKHHLTVWLPVWVEEIIGFMAMATTMIRVENAAAIVLVYETGPYGKATIIAADSAGVPTIALQHGIIHPRHPDYMHDDVTTDPKSNPLAVPIARKTAVYGDYTREALTRAGSYPPESVVVTGQPRYDPLLRAKQVFKKEKICQVLGINGDRKILLLITSTYSDERERLKQAVLSAVKAAQGLNGVQLVVKPHPGESVQFIAQTLKENNAQNVKIIPGYLNELLYISDVVINQGSTVGLEAMLMEKPVVNINYTGLPDQIPFVESGAALGVYQEEHLPRAVRSVLEDSKTREKLRVAREHFVYEQTYKTDGRAAERVADLILEMAKLSRPEESPRLYE